MLKERDDFGRPFFVAVVIRIVNFLSEFAILVRRMSKEGSDVQFKQFIFGLGALCVSQFTVSAEFSLPVDGSLLVGKLQTHQVKQGETFALIAKEYDIGFLALMAANKGVDPFLPEEGAFLTIPTQFILPDVPRTGIVINLSELRLYYFPPNTQTVHVFPVGIGRVGRDTPEMHSRISQKIPNPTWTPPKSIREEYLNDKGVELPAIVPAGPDNPLGDFALRLSYGQGQYLIHGTNKDFGIGLRVSSGCIRMEPKDIKWLFNEVRKGESVRIINTPLKLTLEPDRSVYIEAHEPLTRHKGVKTELEMPIELSWWLSEYELPDARAQAAIRVQAGVPIEIAHPAYD
ncbi:L,D-transpeptidase family protein [Vibrio sp. Of7-15]|uniref:L,D-transpeptidase family protein n=1 Tax=Vibrio sp. Of7-15 TaxID=2724879 RepID=UPI001EF37EDF|nr:L,D-transpeptidase family protein [Vibrio sp. Of7-15]MCG7495582.1 L,D-transpeptidase family protein [Vibrio sp. Of7-15]